MTRYSYIALRKLSILTLSFLALAVSARADSNTLEAAPYYVPGKTYIRIIGDRQPPVRLPAKVQVVKPESDSSAVKLKEEREAAEKREQERLAEVKAEQENEAAFLAAIARLEVRKGEETNSSAEQNVASLIAEGERLAAAKMALIEKFRQEAETGAKLKKTTPIKQTGRRNKAIKKGQNNCK